MAGPFAACLAVIGGCANPRGTAGTLSAIVPASSPAVSSAPASSPAVSSPAVSSPAVSSPAVSSPAVSSASGSTYIRDSTQISGAVTSASERELVVSYVGGVCDVSARGGAIESGSSITVHVWVTTRNAICTAQGFGRTATAQLSAPWGNRVVRDLTGATVPVVDGALLLRPSWLPDGYQADPIEVSASDGNVGVGQDWRPPLVTALSSAGISSCTAGTSAVGLRQGLGSAPLIDPLLPGSYALADGTRVSVYRDDQGELELHWTPPHHPNGWIVALQAFKQCEGDQPLSLDTMLKIANGLH